MSRVWLAQCLCPKRHAILAAAAEAEDQPTAQEAIVKPLRERITEMVKSGTINPWCGLCQSPVESWRYELGRTPYRSMQEAEPSLRAAESEQSVVREAFQ
jgi:hypothetical protein